MSAPVKSIAVGLVVALAAAFPAAAQDASLEGRLRDALRSATAQVRSLEDERARLQAQLAEAEREKEVLRQQAAAAATQDKDKPAKPAVDEETLAEYKRRLADQAAALAQLNDALEKWKAAFNEAANVARAKETERAQLATQVPPLTQRLTACEAKNVALFKVGNEILARYAGIGLGDALGAREPFIGFKRVELQNLVQDYQDKLLDQKVTK